MPMPVETQKQDRETNDSSPCRHCWLVAREKGSDHLPRTPIPTTLAMFSVFPFPTQPNPINPS